MKVKLVMFKQDGQRRDFELKRDTATIGRNVDCDFQIPLEVISRRHTQIFLKDGKLFARDLGSSNGTFVNTKRIQEQELAPGDTLTIGPVIFTIVVDGKPEDVKPVPTVIGPEEAQAAQAAQAATAKEAPKTEAGTVDVTQDEVEEVETVEEVEEEESTSADNPLSELEALSKPKKKP